MIDAGVPAGASRPCHWTVAYPGTPASAMVGASGSKALRSTPLVASALNLPALICGSTDAIVASMA